MLRRDGHAGQNAACDLGRSTWASVGRMRLSTRNQLSGTIAEITLGTVMATVKVTLDPGGPGATFRVRLPLAGGAA